MAQTRNTVTNKKTGEKRTYITRLVEEKEIEAAIEVVCDSFIAPLPTEDLKECRQIQDLNKRKEELIKRLVKHTKGQVKTLEEAGSPDDVINCTTREELVEYYARDYVTHSVKDGMCVGVFTEDNRTMVAIWLGSGFNPQTYLEKKETHSDDYPIVFLLYDMDRKFADDFLHRPEFATYREEVRQSPTGNLLHWDVGGVALNHRGYGLLDIAQQFGLHRAFSLGYRFVFAECVSPITHYTSNKSGFKAHLPASVGFAKWSYKGVKYFEPLSFKSVIPGGDSTSLLMYGSIYEILTKISPEKEKPKPPLQQTQQTSLKTTHTQIAAAAALIGALVILYRLKSGSKKQ